MQPPLGASVTEDPVTSLLQAYPTGCLLLRDSLAASGHFLMPWMTAAALNQGHKVVFIAAAYSASKHTAALRKVGAPGITSQAISSGSSSSITFVSPATGKAKHPATGSSISGIDSSAAAPQHEEQQQQQQLPRLQQLYQQVAAAARQLLAAPQQIMTAPALQQQQPCLTIIVDSVTVLFSLLSDEQQVAAFIHHLMALGDLLQVPSRVILLAAADVAAENLLLAAAAARADVIADVAPLEGRTAAVDGSLTVTVRQAARTSPWSIYHQLQQQQQQQGLGHDNTQQQQQQQPPGWLCPGSSSVWFFRAGDVGVKWLHEVQGKELMA